MSTAASHARGTGGAAARRAKTLWLAEPRGFCAGVRYAVEIAEAALRRHDPPLHALHELVHNRRVVASFEQRGVVFVERIEDVPRGGVVLFSAHGVSPAVSKAAHERDLTVLDATCPFVRKVHQEVVRFAQQGCTIALIGHRGHAEIIGVAGEAPEHVVIVESIRDAEGLRPADPSRVAMVTQTTLSQAEAEGVRAVLRRRFPAVREPPSDDICYATTNRQAAVRKLAGLTRHILVLGSPTSSNTQRLVEVARSAGAEAWLIGEPPGLPVETLRELGAVGLTAGASTPESALEEALAALRDLGYTQTRTIRAATERLRFRLPPSLGDALPAAEASPAGGPTRRR